MCFQQADFLHLGLTQVEHQLASSACYLLCLRELIRLCRCRKCKMKSVMHYEQLTELE